MATEAPATNLPLLYSDLVPLSSNMHAKHKLRPLQAAPFIRNVHAIPLTSDEFIVSQRFYPIIFSLGDNPVPLALMGLNEGVNVFVDEEGAPINESYMPAYVRRYPFLLARLRPDVEELSLCFDPTSDVVSDQKDGSALFEGDKPSSTTTDILKFCEEFELSAQRTNAFMKELNESGLLIEGEVAIAPQDQPTPFIYRGFRMVSEEKLRELSGDRLQAMQQSGMLALIMAHLFSLSLIREVFGRQLNQGKIPQQTPEMAEA